jgi:hypothetical protein
MGKWFGDFWRPADPRRAPGVEILVERFEKSARTDKGVSGQTKGSCLVDFISSILLTREVCLSLFDEQI